MGITRASLAGARERLQETLEEAFPGTVTIGGMTLRCSCSGGREYRDFDERGLEVTRRQYIVRIRKTALTSAPEAGTRLTWTPDSATGADEAVSLRVQEVPRRPEDNCWALRCGEC